LLVDRRIREDQKLTAPEHCILYRSDEESIIIKKNDESYLTQDGGNLRIFSKCMNGAVADVMPIFDRVVFFWSDSR
jgi:hypothetical protein